MTTIVDYLRADRNYTDILCKHIDNFLSVSNDKELIKRTADLDFADLISLFDDFSAFNEPKYSTFGIYLMCIDMEIRFRINRLEREMDSLNPDTFFWKHKSDFLKILSNKIIIIRKGKRMYRSRKGCHEILFETNGIIQNYHNYPYFDNEISNPPIHLAKAERFNRDRYSYLYLANTINTALSEIRPEVKEICSIGTFVASRKLTLLDLRKSKKIEDLVLRSTTKGWKIYYFSQFISDIARELGLDGIWYRSVQSNGECAVIFNPDVFPFLSHSEQLYRVEQNNLIFESLEDEKKTTSFIIKGNKRFKDSNTSIVFNEDVLHYIESNEDAQEMFDIDEFTNVNSK